MAVRRMNAAMVHRGPDGEGEFVAPNVMLAMRRLSIIDLAHGWQPLYNEDRSLALIANGEIYNFVELRADLEQRGHRFATHSDCETILHLYEEQGDRCVNSLRGMFAFALWDSGRQRLLLGRDRMGEKPLYLYETADRLVFASEMKALLRSGLVPFDLDPEAVDLYFHYHYVPEPRTPLRGVRKLDAAHTLTVDTRGWRCEETRYWCMEDAPALDGDPAELIRAKLDEVSQLVIRSDVPVGVALSGGLDSSAIAALAVRHYPGIMHAFSVGYEGRPPCDERDDARTFAQYLQMPFHEVELRTSDMVDSFADLVCWRDDPIADISGYGYYAVMKAAREHGVPVMLQGQGGDELFWGYPWVHEAVVKSEEKKWVNQEGWWSARRFLNLPKPEGSRPWQIRRWIWQARAEIRRVRDKMASLRAKPASRMFFYDLAPEFYQTQPYISAIYADGFKEELAGFDPMTWFSFPSPLKDGTVRVTRLICDSYLRENGIVQGDRLGMASSVELRLPLLDHRIVETVIGLRKRRPDHRFPPKAWFKAALEPIMPNWVMSRPKRGFTPPVREWHQAMFARYGSHLDGGYLVREGVLGSRAARLLATGSYSDDVTSYLSFKALVLELWCKSMAEQSGRFQA